MDRSDPQAITKLRVALTIAGSDSGGGAGIQADLRTFAALGVYGASAITALTAQNTTGVRATYLAPAAIVAAEIEAILDDFAVAAIKIGMLGSAEIARTVAKALQSASSRKRGEGVRPFVVYDPVMSASTGDPLSGPGFIAAVKTELLPLVDCLTPNLAEAAALTGEQQATSEARMTSQGRALLALGPHAVLMKGGHLEREEAVDLLVTAGKVHRFAAARIASANLHGTGCTLSSAIAAYRVLGLPLVEAVGAAKAFACEAIERGRAVALGAGPGPLLQMELQAPH